MTRPAGGIVETTAPLLHLTLRRRRVRLGLLRETLTAVADLELRRRGVPDARRRSLLCHLRRFVSAFGHRDGLPDDDEVRTHLRRLRRQEGLPPSFVEGRAAAAALLFGLAGRPAPSRARPGSRVSRRDVPDAGIASAAVRERTGTPDVDRRHA